MLDRVTLERLLPCLVRGHSYEFDMHQNWDSMENFLAYVSGYKDEIRMESQNNLYQIPAGKTVTICKK